MNEQSDRLSDARAPRVPAGRRIYVVGDIHARHDLVVDMHRLILADAASIADATPVVVYLGDYVDRGPNASDVIDLLINEPLPGFEIVHLKGNHEDMMLRFIDGAEDPDWLLNGGSATLTSYGIAPGRRWFETVELAALRKQFLAALPPAHVRFLRALRLTHVEGDYFFVHAGVRPDRSLDEQEPHDLLWIRGRFLDRAGDLGMCIVHGHTISLKPDTAPGRIGIDTGAFFTGRLTCLVLEGAEQRFLST